MRKTTHYRARLLQQAWHVRTMDQRGQGRDQMDAAVMPHRGRGVAADVRRHPVADRPAACTARSCMTAGLRCERTMREVRPIAGKAARFHASRGRLAGSIACDLHEVRFVVVEDAQRRDAASKSLGIGGMSVYNFRPLIAERR